MVEYVETKEYFYERRIFPMSRGRIQKPSSSGIKNTVAPNVAVNNEAHTEDTHKTPKPHFLQVFVSTYLPIFSAVGVVVSIIASFALNASNDIVRLNTQLENLNTRIEKIDNEIDNVEHYDKDIAVIQNDIAYIKNALSKISETSIPVSYMKIEPTESFQNAISLNFKQNPTIDSSSVIFSEETIIGTDAEGNSLRIDDLEGIPFCTNYFEDGYDVWFYGRLNENGKWDGLCILNNYIDNQLYTLFESVYSNGVRIGDYRSISYDGKEYVFNDRTYYGTYNTGKTYRYKDIKMPEYKFMSEIPVRYDECKNGNIVNFYYGRTVDELYNDKTGTAFYVKYDEDGIIKTFYQGCFENGKFVDDRPFSTENSSTENTAFWIVLADDDSQYLYYMGSFKNGQPTQKKWYEKDGARIPTNENPGVKLPERNDYPDLKWKSWQHAV